MIQKDLGWCQTVVTDTKFGGVMVDDQSFEKRFQNAFKIYPQAIIWMNQVHSPIIQAVMTPVMGSLIFPKCDGLITNQKNTLLITRTADCVPILLWHENERIIAILHCGWKGFFQGIIESFEKKCQELGYSSHSFSAFLGPHLRKESFEVQDDFIKVIPENKKKYLIKINGKQHYDLTLGVKEALEILDIKNIEESQIDTFQSPEYFSYRTVEGGYSRFASCIIMALP